MLNYRSFFSITAYMISAISDNLHLSGILDTIYVHAFSLSRPVKMGGFWLE